MITSLRIKNFKTLQDTGEIPLKSLNLLTGINGTGKSSFVQALLLMRQSYESRKLPDSGELLLNGSLVDIGTGRDALYHFASEHESIEFEVKFNWQGQTDEENRTFTGNFKLKYEADKSILQNANSLYFRENVELDINREDLERVIRESSQQIQADIESKYKPQSLFNGNFQYLKAMHIRPIDTYKEGVIDSGNPLGLEGENTVHYLNYHNNRKEIAFENFNHPKARSKGLLHQVNAWLGEISPNVRLKTTKIPNTELIIAGYEFGTRNDYTDQFKPKNIGFGISYVLPVITAILSAEKDRLIILENPEAHLHPRGQARMGRLIALAAQNDIQLIIETHSDHILNGVRVAIKKGEVAPEKVGLLYFKREFENRQHRSTIIIPKIDSDGRVDQWPDGFFDEWENMLDELI